MTKIQKKFFYAVKIQWRANFSYPLPTPPPPLNKYVQIDPFYFFVCVYSSFEKDLTSICYVLSELLNQN